MIAEMADSQLPIAGSDDVRVLQGDCRVVLAAMPAESVHCVVTSPPYWGLRDYGVAPTTWPTGWVGCHGAEPTVELYVEHEVLIFREVRRVLRGDGTLWLVLGDTYAGGGMGGGGSFAEDGIRMAAEAGTDKNVAARPGARLVGKGLKRKDLVGVPWRVALALQADGWWLRGDNIWHKPNPMPESVQDRATRAHDYVFMLSKAAKYFYDVEGAKEAVTGNAHARSHAASQFPAAALRNGHRRRLAVNPKAVAGMIKFAGRNSRTYRDRDLLHPSKPKQNPSFSGAISGLVGRRNLRSVWTSEDHKGLFYWMYRHYPSALARFIEENENALDVWTLGTAPYKGAHFATFPAKLAARCILAGTSEKGCCSSCGAPFRRVMAKGEAMEEWKRQCGADTNGEYHGVNTKDYQKHKAQAASTVKARILAGMVEKKTVGWEAGCKCGGAHGVTRPTVLDPFGGSGTVGMVAQEMGRKAILIELNPEYLPLIAERISQKRT